MHCYSLMMELIHRPQRDTVIQYTGCRKNVLLKLKAKVIFYFMQILMEKKNILKLLSRAQHLNFKVLFPTKII